MDPALPRRHEDATAICVFFTRSLIALRLLPYSEKRPGRKSSWNRHMNPMLNAFEVIRANPTAKRFEIGEMLFAPLAVVSRQYE